MEAPKQIITQQELNIDIKKDLKSEQGNNCNLQIYFKENKFNIIIKKKEKLFNEKFQNEFSISQIQENEYFKMFSTPKEIMEELKDRIDAKNPKVNEIENNTINLIIFIPINKFKQIEFNLNKKDDLISENSDDLKSIIEKLYEKVEKLEIENKKLLEENKQIKEKNKNIETKLEKMENTAITPLKTKRNNFHWICNEVNVVNSSKFMEGREPEIMLGKSNSGPYSLTEGNRNHFLELSFIKTYFLESIRIKADNYECSIKTFSVELIKENGDRINIGVFIRSTYNDNKDFQEFEINNECKGIKLYLIDNWGSYGGNCILITRIEFNVSD